MLIVFVICYLTSQSVQQEYKIVTLVLVSSLNSDFGLELSALLDGADVDDPEDPLLVFSRRFQEEVLAGAEGHVDRPDGPVEDERGEADLQDLPSRLLSLRPVAQVEDLHVFFVEDVVQNLGEWNFYFAQ